MRTPLLALFLVAAPATLAAQATPAAAATPVPTSHAPTHHRMTGMISKDSAQKIALAQVANATVQSSEREREHGRTIYSFDLKVAGQDGTTEVNIDAHTGAVVNTEHESAAAEKEEHAREHRAAHPAAKPAPASAPAPAAHP